MMFSVNNDHFFTAYGLKQLGLSHALLLAKACTNGPWNFTEAFQPSRILYRLFKLFHQIQNI